MSLQTHERQAALVMPQTSLVEALEAALISRDEARSLRVKTTVENLDLRDQVDNLTAEVERLRNEVATTNSRLAAEVERSGNAAAAADEQLAAARQRSKVLKEEKTGLEDGLRAVNARNKRLEVIIAGLEAALVHRGDDAVISAIRQAVDEDTGDPCTLADLRDPLKFLFRVATRNTHPSAGGNPSDFLRVQTAYRQLLRNTDR